MHYYVANLKRFDPRTQGLVDVDGGADVDAFAEERDEDLRKILSDGVVPAGVRLRPRTRQVLREVFEFLATKTTADALAVVKGVCRRTLVHEPKIAH